MQERKESYRLVTRSNFDGIVSGALLKRLGLVEEMLFVHPKEIQDGKVAISQRDIVTNLPYVKSAYMAFDHHLDGDGYTTLNQNHILFNDVYSTSQLIYEYYGAQEVFGSKVWEMVEAANKSKTAHYTKEEVLSPSGWTLLAFLTDARTGLGYFKNFTISNYQLMQELVDLCQDGSIEKILSAANVKERVEHYRACEEPFVEQLKRCTRFVGDVAVIDLSQEERIYPGNRFMVYALFEEIGASVHILRAKEKNNVVFALGKSIFNRTNHSHIGAIVSNYGGGGHKSAGSCQVASSQKEEVLQNLLSLLTKAPAVA